MAAKWLTVEFGPNNCLKIESMLGVWKCLFLWSSTMNHYKKIVTRSGSAKIIFVAFLVGKHELYNVQSLIHNFVFWTQNGESNQHFDFLESMRCWYFWIFLNRYCKYAWTTESGNSELVDEIANSTESAMESTMADSAKIPT